MSKRADDERSQRQQFAAPGGSHDRLVRTLRVALPAIIGLLVAVLAFSPFAKNDELSFVLAKDDVGMAKERMRLTAALYRGEDSKGRPFSLSAGSAVQKSSADPVLRMSELSGRILMQDGPTTLAASRGNYNLVNETMRVDGPLALNAADGYSLVANNVEFAMKTQKMQSYGPVTGSTKVGTFQGGRLSADLNTRIVRIDGGVHLRIDRNAIK